MLAMRPPLDAPAAAATAAAATAAAVAVAAAAVAVFGVCAHTVWITRLCRIVSGTSLRNITPMPLARLRVNVPLKSNALTADTFTLHARHSSCFDAMVPGLLRCSTVVDQNGFCL